MSFADQSVKIVIFSFALQPDYAVSLGLVYVNRRVAMVEAEKPVIQGVGFFSTLQWGMHVQYFSE